MWSSKCRWLARQSQTWYRWLQFSWEFRPPQMAVGASYKTPGPWLAGLLPGGWGQIPLWLLFLLPRVHTPARFCLFQEPFVSPVWLFQLLAGPQGLPHLGGRSPSSLGRGPLEGTTGPLRWKHSEAAQCRSQRQAAAFSASTRELGKGTSGGEVKGWGKSLPHPPGTPVLGVYHVSGMGFALRNSFLNEFTQE